MTHLDVPAIYRFNAGVRRARNAYQADPTALGDQLARICFMCRQHRHIQCNRHIRTGRRSQCRCDNDRHEEAT